MSVYSPSMTHQYSQVGSKLVTTIVSTFTANYIHSWPTWFPDTPLTFPLPTFDGRAVCYPSVQNLRDYLSWRQVDCKAERLEPGQDSADFDTHRPHQ